MRIVVVVFAIVALVALRPAAAQPTLLAIEDGEFSFFEPIMNESGEAFAILGFSLVHQDGSLTAPNPILAPDGPIGSDTLKLIHTDSTGPRPLAPVFGSDTVLLNARIERPDTTQVNSLILVSPTGQVVRHIDGDNAALFFEGVTPTDKEFGMQSARSFLGDAIPNNQLETVIGFATAAVDAQSNPPTAPFMAIFGAGTMNVLSADLGFRPTLIESHGAKKDTISINDLPGPIGAAIPDSVPAFQYGYTNVNSLGSFVLRPAGADANTRAYVSSVFLVDGSAQAARGIDVSTVETVRADTHEGLNEEDVRLITSGLSGFGAGALNSLFFSVREILEMKGNGFGSIFAAKALPADAPGSEPKEVGGIKMGPIATMPIEPPEGCDCDEKVDPNNPNSPARADLDGNGMVDVLDIVIARKCSLEDPSGENCRDVNKDGKVDLKDGACVIFCFELAAGFGGQPGAERGLQAGLVDPLIAIELLTEGAPVPDRPQLTLGSASQGVFGLTRAHPNGFGLFAVRAFAGDDPSGSKILLISQAPNGPPKTVFEEGVDYGDGVVATIPGNGVSNINRAGQFAVVAILESGETAIYSIKIEGGFPPQPNKSRASWRLYI